MNTKLRVLLIGTAIGAVVGALTGWIYYNATVAFDEEGHEIVPTPSPATGVKLGIGLLGLMRLIAGD